MKGRKVTTLSDEEKAEALKVIGKELDKLERAHGESIVRWAFNRRHDERVEKEKLNKEKAALEKRLAEIS